MDAPVKQNLVRAGIGILLFMFFLFFTVEVQIKRLEGKVHAACGRNTEFCIREQITLARWHTPINDAPRRAAESAFKLIATGGFSAETERTLLWELRTSVFGSRNFTRPETRSEKSKLLMQIDKRLGVFLPARIHRGDQAEPVYGFQIAAQICFFSWILFVLLAIWRGMTAKGEILWGSCLRFSGAAIFAFCSWLFCLSLA